MYLLPILAFLELAFATLPGAGLPQAFVCGVILMLMLMLVLAMPASVRAGFISRLAYGMSVLWYVGALARWMPNIDSLYDGAGMYLGFGFALTALLLVPGAFLLVACLSPVVTLNARGFRGLRRNE